MDSKDKELILSAHFKEYDSLMGEIKLRLQAQNTLLNITVVLVVGGLAFLTASIDSGNSEVLLFAPIILLIIAWWYIAYNLMIGQTARYVYGPLATKVNTLIKPDAVNDDDDTAEVWNWISYQYEDFSQRTKHIYFFNSINFLKYAPWFVPSILSIIVFLGIQNRNNMPLSNFQKGLIYFDTAVWLITFIGVVFFLGWKPRPRKEGEVRESNYEEEKVEEDTST